MGTLVANGATAPSCGLKTRGTKGNVDCWSVGRETNPMVCVADFVKGFSIGRQVSIVFYRRNNGMPKKGVIEKAEETAGDFLWMPDVVTPLYDILKSLSKTAWTVLTIVLVIMFLLTWYGMFREARLLGYQTGVAFIAPPVGIAIGCLVVLAFLIFFGGMVSPIDVFGFPILHTYPNTCPATHPELHGLLCYKPCPAGRHRVSDVCWADSVSIGIGTPVGLEPCPDGWNNWGLICQKPLKCFSIEDCFNRGRCGCSGGDLWGRLNGGGVCPGPQDAGGLPGFDDWYKRWKAAANKSPRTKKKCAEPAGAHDNERTCEEEKLIQGAEHVEWLNIFATGNRDIKPGMCYKKCPKGMTHVPLLPYLCVRTEADGKPMRLDYYDADSKVPSMIQLFGRFNI